MELITKVSTQQMWLPSALYLTLCSYEFVLFRETLLEKNMKLIKNINIKLHLR